MIDFVLIGGAGYVAPRHMQAIKDVGGNLIATLDPSDSIGVIDKYFPDCAYFREFERFDRHCYKRKEEIAYVTICSPNYLHDSHVIWALRLGANAICEKPLTLTTRNLDRLIEAEKENPGKVNVILQLRYAYLSWLFGMRDNTDYHKVNVCYYTPRGKWYHYSWKGNEEKSGGLPFNIGIHLFDLLIRRFGSVSNYRIRKLNAEDFIGSLYFQNAEAHFDLSISQKCDPERSIYDNGEIVKMDGNFTGLHTTCYEEILSGRGHGILDIYPATKFLEEVKCQY